MSKLDPSVLRDRITRACDWLTDVTQLKTEDFPSDTIDSFNHRHSTWTGAIRGEYSAAKRQWDFFCPVWHTGQAVKALLLASSCLNSEKYYKAAVAGAEFIFANQIWDTASPNHGLILAYEDYGDKVNTSAILEGMDGLIMLADLEAREDWWDRLIKAGEFILKRVYMPAEGMYRDMYDPATHSICPPPYRTKDNIGGRPLNDDAIMLKLYKKTGDKKFLDAHIKVSETLVADQNPPGNWVDYAPCNPLNGAFHPRQAYWWGLPLIDTYRATGRKEFLDTAIASGEFLKKSMRKDGGFFRGYFLDGKTNSFGHATSGSACSAIVFMELFKVTQDTTWVENAETALEFCMKVQFIEPRDPNLKGAILEKVLPPNGTDDSPYYLRDLGTIFFIQAAVAYLTLPLVNKGTSQ